MRNTPVESAYVKQQRGIEIIQQAAKACLGMLRTLLNFKTVRKEKNTPAADDRQKEIELVLFRGASNGKGIDLSANNRLAKAGLAPAKELVTEALSRRAHMLRLDPKGQASAVIMVVDGVPYPAGRLPKHQGLAITQMMKLLAGLNVKQRTQPQAGGIKAEYRGRNYELLVDSTPTEDGVERLTLRLRDLSGEFDRAEGVGFTEKLKFKIQTLGARKRGVLLMCGPLHSGTTTTTYAVLRTIDAYIYSMFSIADTGNREVRGLTQFQPNPDDALAVTLDRIIRCEADVIFVDPVKDAKTAKTIFAKQKNVTFLSEFSAKDSAHGVLQLIRWLGDPKQVAEGLLGIVTQRLVRKLCDKCKEAYRPNPKIIAKMGLPPETTFLYHPPKPKPGTPEQPAEEVEPCHKCGGLGYFGRIGLYELFEVTDAMRELIAQGPKGPAELNAQARNEKQITLQRDGLRLVVEGKTSLEESQRALKAGHKPAESGHRSLESARRPRQLPAPNGKSSFMGRNVAKGAGKP